MTTVANVGVSHQTDSFQAGVEAATQALSSLTGPANLLIVFTTIVHDQDKVVQGIRSVTGNVPLFGGSSAGVLVASGFHRNSVGVMALCAAGLTVTMASSTGVSQAPRQAGQSVAQTLNEALMTDDEDDRYASALILVDPLSGSSQDVIQGTADVLGPMCTLTGGATGHNLSYDKTFQIINDQVHTDTLVAALLQSTEPISLGISHGYKAVGQPMVATRVEGNIIHELDGQPAFEVYRQLWAAEAPDLNPDNFVAFAKTRPIGLPQLRGEYVIRDVVEAYPNGGLRCAAAVAENAVVSLMVTDQNDFVTAAGAAAQQAVAGLEGHPPAALIFFDCTTRFRLMGDAAAKDIDYVKEIIGPDVPMLGMFSFGEVATPPEGGLAAFYNKTVVACALA